MTVFTYDPVGNRLKQIIDGDATGYLYDAANRLDQIVNGPDFSFDANGNLLSSGMMTESAGLAAYYEFDPYGNPVLGNGGDPYGYTFAGYASYT